MLRRKPIIHYSCQHGTSLWVFNKIFFKVFISNPFPLLNQRVRLCACWYWSHFHVEYLSQRLTRSSLFLVFLCCWNCDWVCFFVLFSIAAGGVCASIDSFLNVSRGDGGWVRGHFTTFESAVHGVGQQSGLKETRANLNGVRDGVREGFDSKPYFYRVIILYEFIRDKWKNSYETQFMCVNFCSAILICCIY